MKRDVLLGFPLDHTTHAKAKGSRGNYGVLVFLSTSSQHIQIHKIFFHQNYLASTFTSLNSIHDSLCCSQQSVAVPELYSVLKLNLEESDVSCRLEAPCLLF
jgi:hypothetical protein